MSQNITREDFTQIDSAWVCAVDGFHLTIKPDATGAFSLEVSGTLEVIPPATQYPTEPEWTKALLLANKFRIGLGVAKDRQL